MLGVEWIIHKYKPYAADISQLRIVQWAFRVLLFISGTKLTVIGEENVPKDEAVLYIGNHKSFFDIVITYARCPRLTGYVSKDSMAKVPVFSIWMKRLHCLFLNREDMKEALKTILVGIDNIKNGGVTEAFESLSALWDIKVTDPDYAGLISSGMNGWTDMPTFGTPIWLTVVTTLLLGVGIGSIAQPQLAVRFMSAKDDKTLNKSMAIGAVFVFLVLGTAFTIGPLSNVFFYDLHGMTSTEYLSNSDLIIPTFVNELFAELTFGDLFISIFILALVCATISTMAALLHTMGASAGYDLWGQIKERRGQKLDITRDQVKSLKASRVCTLIMMVIVVILAYVMPGNIIAKATTIFMGLTAAAILPTFAYGIFCKSVSPTAAKISIACGAVSWAFWAFFIEQGTSTKIGLCQALFGEPYLIEGLVNYVDPLVIGLPISAVVLVICHFIFKDRYEIPETVASE